MKKEKQFIESVKFWTKTGIIIAKEAVVREFLREKNWEKLIKELESFVVSQNIKQSDPALFEKLENLRTHLQLVAIHYWLFHQID